MLGIKIYYRSGICGLDLTQMGGIAMEKTNVDCKRKKVTKKEKSNSNNIFNKLIKTKLKDGYVLG